MTKKRIVALTGAGISAESGLKTFRDSDGLWEEHRVEDVATVEAWETNRALVTRFYNLRRIQLAEVAPNGAHHALASLEQSYQVDVITQNVDDLHERGGSTHVMHLHGRLTELKSSGNPSHIIDIGYKAMDSDMCCPEGFAMRPNIVWFGEDVPLISAAAEIIRQADILLVIGTSLNVYPAAGLIHACASDCRIILIDPDPDMQSLVSSQVDVITAKAVSGMERLLKELQ